MVLKTSLCEGIVHESDSSLLFCQGRIDGWESEAPAELPRRGGSLALPLILVTIRQVRNANVSVAAAIAAAQMRADAPLCGQDIRGVAVALAMDAAFSKREAKPTRRHLAPPRPC